MVEKRVSVRLAAVGGERVKAELAALGKQGRQALESIAGASGPANAGLTGLGTTAGQALGELEALAARASRAAATLRAAGASTGSLAERIDRVTGVAPAMRRSAADIAAYGAALDELRARHNPLFAVIRDYRATLGEIRRAHAVGALSAEEMQAAIRRERQAALASIAALKGRTGALHQMGAASRLAAFQSRMLMFQLNDVFVSLASGMNPLMVFVQQGAQIAQVYGGGQGGVRGALRDVARMIGGVVTRFPLLTAAIAAGTAAIAGMRSAINATSDVTVGFGDVALAVWQTVRDGLMRVLRPAIEAIAPWFARAWELVVAGVKSAGNLIVNGFRAAFVELRFLWNTLPAVIGAAVTGAANATLTGLELMLNGAVRLLDGLAGRVNEMLAGIPGLPEGARLGRLAPVSLGRLENPYPAEVAARLAERNARIAEIMASDPMGAFFDAVRGRAIANALDGTAEAATRAGAAVKSAAAAAAPAFEKTETAIGKVTAALDGYATEAMDMGRGLGEALAGAFRGAEEAVAAFVRTGKIDFRALVSSMLADLARLSARRFLLGPLANALSGALGGLFGTAAPAASPLPVPRPVLHAGGLVGAPGPMRLVPDSVFLGAPRLHRGGVAGLRPDEVPAILERGERVLSRAETRAWERGGLAPAVTVNILAQDADSFRRSRTQVAADIARAVAFGRRGL